MNKVNTIEVLWKSDKDELLANKFTGAVRVMKTVKVPSKTGKKPSCKRELVRVEYYKDGLLHNSLGPAIKYSKKAVESNLSEIEEYTKDPMKYYPKLPPIKLTNEWWLDGKKIM